MGEHTDLGFFAEVHNLLANKMHFLYHALDFALFLSPKRQMLEKVKLHAPLVQLYRIFSLRFLCK
jgi:hypothetical protein